MSLPAPFNLIPPNIVVSQVASVYGLALPDRTSLTFGYVEQVNYATMSVYAGQRVLYNQPQGTPQFFIGASPYFIIDENKILLTEPNSIPLY